MADSLILTGVKDVKNHTGTEMLLTRPKRGGDTHSLKEWWKAGAGKCYAECTVFNVTTAAGTVKLAIDSNMSTNLRIDHDGAFNFTFYGSNEVRRAALFTDAYELIEHYVFPSISGGKVMTVTPAGGASRPGGGSPPAAPDTTIDNVTVAAAGPATNGGDVVYTATVAGDATPFTYTWSATNGTVTSGGTTSSATITWNASGAQTVTCTVSSDNENFDDNDKSGTLNVSVALSFAEKVAAADASYAVTVVDNGGNVYAIDGTEQDTIAVSNGETIHFDLSDASLAGHPLKIYTDAVKTTEVTDGVEQEGTDLLFTPASTGTFSYQCSAHNAMGGDITVS